jgi:hypothetical protein
MDVEFREEKRMSNAAEVAKAMAYVNENPDFIGAWNVGTVGHKFEIQETVEPGRAVCTGQHFTDMGEAYLKAAAHNANARRSKK